MNNSELEPGTSISMEQYLKALCDELIAEKDGLRNEISKLRGEVNRLKEVHEMSVIIMAGLKAQVKKLKKKQNE